MCQLLRRSLVFAGAATFALGGILSSACSNTVKPEVGSIATAGNNPATISIETSNMFVTVVNNAGAPIQDVQVAIEPVGSVLKFTSSVTRMENGEKRDLSLSQFRGRDGTTFSPRIYKPRQVTVVAKDIVGKTHQRTVAWQ
jgi:hypothetical protein